MVAEDFVVGDLVWAKMKGYCHWPGEILDPSNSKCKKSGHLVFFYGTNNHAWVLDKNIVLHSEASLNQFTTKGQKRPPSFVAGVEMIVKASKGTSKHQKKNSKHNLKKLTSKDESSPKKKSPHSNSSSKKAQIRKNVHVKKDLKKQSLPSDHNVDDNSISKAPSKVMQSNNNFSDWSHNLNYSHDEESGVLLSIDNENSMIQQAPGLLADRTYIECPSSPPINLTEVSEVLEKKKILPTEKKIGFLGLGKMGQNIVKNLLHSGHSVTLWNRTPEKCNEFVEIGAEVSKTPYDVILASDITFCCVLNSDAAKAIVFGDCGVLKALEASKSKNKSYVEMTSLDPEASIEIGNEVIMKGGRYLEAPLHGSRTEANKGSLLILCSGDKTLYDDCESCFKAIGRNYLYTGRNLGTAYKYNIIHNVLLGTVYAAMAESLSLINSVDLKQEEFLRVLKYATFDTAEIVKKGHAMIQTDYTSNIPLKYQQEKIDLGLTLGEKSKQPMPLTREVNRIYTRCRRLRYEDHDVSAIFEGTKL